MDKNQEETGKKSISIFSKRFTNFQLMFSQELSVHCKKEAKSVTTVCQNKVTRRKFGYAEGKRKLSQPKKKES